MNKLYQQLLHVTQQWLRYNIYFYILANNKYTALLWSTGGGGIVAVLDTNNPIKLPFDTPMIKGN